MKRYFRYGAVFCSLLLTIIGMCAPEAYTEPVNPRPLSEIFINKPSLKDNDSPTDKVLPWLKANQAQGDTFAQYTDTENDTIVTGFPRYKSVQVEGPIYFKGDFKSDSDFSKLAVFSDDGVNVWIYDKESDPTGIPSVVSNYGVGQALDGNNSFHIVDKELDNETTYTIVVKYSNIIFIPNNDIDGCTLVAFAGGGSVTGSITTKDDTGLVLTDSRDIVIDVLTNDLPKPGLKVTDVTDASHGTASFTANNVTYTPNTGYSGSDSFSYEVTDLAGNKSSAVVAVTVFTVRYTVMPDICAGGKTEEIHSGTVIIRASSAGINGIPNINVEFALAAPLTPLGAIVTYDGSSLLPTFDPPNALTDADGYARTTIKSGKAVLPSGPGKTCATSEATLKLNGNIIQGSNKSLSIKTPDVYIDACYEDTDIPVYDLYAGEGVDLYGEISFADTNIISHNIEWRFRFFNHEPGEDPLSDKDFLYDGTGEDSPDDIENPGQTLYGSLYDESTPDGYYAYFVTGTQPGWIYWYISDADVLQE